MGRQTPLIELHRSLGARIVDFGGWDMPVQYSSQIAEHHAVRRAAGVFDVSHMCVIDLTGARTREFLQWLLANDVGKLTRPGKALYSCMLNDAGGVIDDLIVYFLSESWIFAWSSMPVRASRTLPGSANTRRILTLPVQGTCGFGDARRAVDRSRATK